MQMMFTLLIPPDYRAAQVNVLFMKCLYPGKCYRRLRREFPPRVTNSYYLTVAVAGWHADLACSHLCRD